MDKEIEAFIAFMYEQRKISANTEAAYARDLARLRIHLEETVHISSLAEVTAECIEQYVRELREQGRKASTISRFLASAKAFFNWQVQTGQRADNPAKGLKAPRIEKKPPEILSQEQILKLLQQPSSHAPKELRDRAMMELLYATGIRVSELVALQLADVNLRMEFVTCRDEYKERTVPFGETARKALEEYLLLSRPKLVHDRECELLFTNCSGEPMSRQGFWKIVKHYGRQAGISDEITPHMLRHSFAAHLLGNGADLKSVQELMGHADITTTQVYMQFSERKVRKVYKQAHPRF